MILEAVRCFRGLNVETFGSGVPSIISTTFIFENVITSAITVTNANAAYT